MTVPALVSIAVDADGYCWRVFDDGTWSMCPTNPDNSPVPTPVTFFDRRDSDAWARAVSAAAALGAALAEFDNARDALALARPNGGIPGMSAAEHDAGVTNSWPASKRTPTPRLDLYSVVWEASVHMTDDEIMGFVRGTLADARSEEARS